MVMLSSGKGWIKSADVNTGDVITMVTGGEWQESATFKNADGTPTNQFVIEVSTGGQTRNMSLNKVSRTQLAAAWGNDTEKWIGKTAIADKVKVMVGGEMKDSIVLTPTPEGFEVESEEEVPF